MFFGPRILLLGFFARILSFDFCTSVCQRHIKLVLVLPETPSKVDIKTNIHLKIRNEIKILKLNTQVVDVNSAPDVSCEVLFCIFQQIEIVAAE